MTRVGLITTGQCEHRSLATSLNRVFAGEEAEFESVLRNPIESLTSNYLSYPPPTSRAPTLVDKLVDALDAAISARRAPDVVMVIDDLELPNLQTPENVTRLVCDAVNRRLARSPTHREIGRFRERCSFHLLSPMVEAYFFGEPAALERAGARRQALLNPDRNLEDFESIDDDYLRLPDESDHRRRRPDRAKHPKRYLRFLAEPELYAETRGGCRALSSLDWAQVIARDAQGPAFAYSLFEDVAEVLGVRNPFEGYCHHLTAPKTRGVMRNIAEA